MARRSKFLENVRIVWCLSEGDDRSSVQLHFFADSFNLVRALTCYMWVILPDFSIALKLVVAEADVYELGRNTIPRL